MKYRIVSALMLASVGLAAQQPYKGNSYVLISAGDGAHDIIRKAASVTPTPRQLRWQQLELTAFFHFGVNTFTDKEWGNGQEDPAVFNPTALDAVQWIRSVKAAGFKQVILTAKHHDGFCLWPSRYTNHSVKYSPWKNGQGDVVKEVADACHQLGVGFGVYLSPWDRNHASYGTDAYNKYFENQLTELLTQYGRVDEVWFDGANGEGPNGKKQVYDFNSWYALIRKLQPHAVIAVMGPDVRWVGTESGYGRDTEWSVIPADDNLLKKIADGSQQDVAFVPTGDKMQKDLGSRDKIMGAKGLMWYPAEADVSIRPGWFYHAAEDGKVKAPEKLLDIYFSSAGKNAVLLLNIPPDRRGLINEHDSLALGQFGQLVKETFQHNLAKGAVITAANGTHTQALTDKNYNTYFTTLRGDTTTTIDLDLRAPKTFDVVCLQENILIGQRIEQFVVEYQDNATQAWKEVVAGTTVGYKRLFRFPAITAQKVRLKILSSRLQPALSAFGLYKLGGR